MIRYFFLINLVSFGLVTDNFAKIFVIGDSLTEGYGVEKGQSYPALLQEMVDKKAPNRWKVTNAGISGSTTASGVKRLKWILKAQPKIVIIALGANDGLRGFPVDLTKKNLSEMIGLAKKNNIKVLLTGLEAPPNYGKEYTNHFRKVFRELSQQEKVLLVPFLLEGVAGEAQLNQADGIHPNEKGHKIIAENVFKYLKDLL